MMKPLVVTNSYRPPSRGDGPTPRRLVLDDLDIEEIRLRASLLVAGSLDANEYANTSWRRPWTRTNPSTWHRMRRFLKANADIFREQL